MPVPIPKSIAARSYEKYFFTTINWGVDNNNDCVAVAVAVAVFVATTKPYGWSYEYIQPQLSLLRNLPTVEPTHSPTNGPTVVPTYVRISHERTDGGAQRVIYHNNAPTDVPIPAPTMIEFAVTRPHIVIK